MSDTQADISPEQYSGLLDTIEILRESFSDMQRVLDRDQAGWLELGSLSDRLEGFTADFRRRHAARILVAVVGNPLIKRGVSLRGAYIWGPGVTITVDDVPDQGQDINGVVQAFLDDKSNRSTFTSTEARTGWERSLACVGEVWLCLPTDEVTGRVRVRTLPAEQVTDIVTDPEDEATDWLYLREWTPKGATTARKVYHPALGYSPAIQDDARTLPSGETIPIRWDAPVRMVRVNSVAGRGIGDAFAAVPWAHAYKSYLEDWSRYMAALSRIAYTVTSRGDKVNEVAARMTAALAQPAGGGIALDPNSKLEALSKSSATIDADSGRPMAAMVAAALDLPVTTLLGDPGVTGARATAETVSDDSWAVFDVRRDMWRDVISDVIDHVIDAAVIAPAGPLRGTIVRDGDRLTAELPDGDSRTVHVDFPERDDSALLDRVKAVQLVDQSEKLAPLVALRLYLKALGVRDADEIVDLVTDEHGNFVPLDVAQAAVRQGLQDGGLPA